ncbi:ornithine carbamoyltransferase [Thalassospiraceae bacterium LMO-SO8]|nr:ornithine carbamoyltransferase [Alphaproteobacteria bacterium LMO-S08]WND74316.1 ornithine carbamoyltransferase [Thalassospiraceae bacterium LMO-SO8]
MSALRHFLDLDRTDAGTLRRILDRAAAMKKNGAAGSAPPSLAGKTLVMIFEKPSTRTRVSFEVAIQQLGGRAVVLSGNESQLGRGETVADTARVLSRYCDVIMIRTDDPQKLHDLAEYATVPVINGLTDASHPCQIMADIMTYEEHRGGIKGRTVAWAGDGNNVAASWIHGAARFGYQLRLACPEALSPNPDLVAWAAGEGADVQVTEDADAAVAGADLVVTDTWVSMGDADAGSRHNLLTPYRVDDRLMKLAAPDALFMHCLPAHRGEEVTESVIDGPQSVIWDEAENRLHAQKGILAWCLGDV